ncbi:MAG TPA: histidinol-phosphate transaminase [Candidatus Acidoferrum sp.]|nr:histidinol-phosphate transaminase [Candidatus Acidoferrum sp.]
MRPEPNPHLLAIHRVDDAMAERLAFVRLDRNERVTPFPEPTVRAMLSEITPETLCAYPDPSPLYARLSRELELPVDHLHLTPGSDAAIRVLFHAYVRPGDRVVTPDPTYAMYAIYTRMFQAVPDTVAYGRDRRLDLDLLISKVRQRPRLVALPNPDQPTGTVVSLAELREVASAAAAVGALFIVDEAYFPFHPITALSLVTEFDNVVVTRTFSKVGGLAGLRLGYLAGNPGIVDAVRRVRGSYEVNSVAISLGCYVLDHPEMGEAFRREIEEGRRVLCEGATRLGLDVPGCPTNFQLVRLPGSVSPAVIVDALRGRGYLVRGPFGAPAVQDCIRVTLGDAEIMAGFVSALEAVVQEAVEQRMAR